jgi:hypothetical protein
MEDVRMAVMRQDAKRLAALMPKPPEPVVEEKDESHLEKLADLLKTEG